MRRIFIIFVCLTFKTKGTLFIEIKYYLLLHSCSCLREHILLKVCTLGKRFFYINYVHCFSLLHSKMFFFSFFTFFLIHCVLKEFNNYAFLA